MPVLMEGLSSLTIRIDGELLASDNVAMWPRVVGNENQFPSMFNFSRCNDLLFTGNGIINGQGHKWWVKAILRQIPDARPHLIYVQKHATLLRICRERHNIKRNVTPSALV
eukprot:1196267-Prorocentrum_minimum.AAC.9